MPRQPIHPPEYIPPPASSANRDRSWEQRQRNGDYCTITTRRIPVELRDQINQVASERLVSATDLTRLFLEYALEAYQKGDITIKPTLHGKFTLFPNGK